MKCALLPTFLLPIILNGFSLNNVEPKVRRLAAIAEGEEDTLFAFGVNLATRYADVKRLFNDDEIKEIVKGIDGYLLDNVDAESLLREKATAINEMLSMRAMKAVENEKEKGKEFLIQAAEREGATQTDSGLVFEHIKEGSGPSPTSGSTVKVHYTGTLIDGTVFDSSRERGEPAQFALAQVIKGWQEGLLLMQEGGSAKLTIPSDLAYGDNGSSDRIPGGATLAFEVELLNVLTGGVGGLIL
uniref:peptidylprolyl isomerase n=1 Tax=Aureoumbra lagunensis TaxID=44058 RepID=A0A7S3K2R8_9STRA|mmetsp:Transcript_1674/g.2551  ORF Transcript_1674/g.2551 Transcript_1674/m.2551 type:complete len:243 (+) Transcript_1674:151-879(+)|eukprot:CAMPEP_0197318248 /NCGR_PEP_ID=MMETSP0891-20130614/50133_1 /TAXON_ID=44058 ORGANISM="Aureoumbra lagunensis, Strain CCMP1510" /NCGR_SAMPLE_ID=MMETSP0891 /ASSEMBLY_ACC=CAM_ASM_000534 /LENGTH=242 /DNA_ID=CAMNT_0042808591 /DNA_START=153 /DNA_END=881 /DNA_ORIENTATION=-